MDSLTNSQKPRVFWPGFCGLAATLIGLGIGRFAFVALLPGIISENWFSSDLAGYLQSATLLGYLIGGITAHRVSEKFGSHLTIKAAMVTIAVAYCTSFTPFSYSWFLLCRFAAGVTGAWLVVVAPAYVFHRTAHEDKGTISGLIFSGLGVGVIVSAAIVPALISISLSATWIGLGVAAFIFTFASWRFWADDSVEDASMDQPANRHYRLAENKQHSKAVILLLFVYALDATGYLPHTIYWVNFIVHSLDKSISEGSFYWMLFGTGAAIGPFAVAKSGDLIGFPKTLVLAFILKSTAVFLPTVSTAPWALAVSSIFVGGLTAGVVALVSAVTLEIVGKYYHKQVWGWMTTSFALAQAIMGYGVVYLFNTTQNYMLLFYLGGGCLLAAALISLEIRRLLR